VASCAPSLHEETFRNTLARAGLNPYLYEHANIREQVSWVHHGEAATRKATRLVAAAVGKARFLEPLEPLRVEARRHATVIGGGMAGLKAAKDLAQRGFAVALIEKSPFLGGRTARLDRVAPTGERAADLVTGLIGAVLNDEAVTIHTCSEVAGFEGYVGNFSLKVRITPPEFRPDDQTMARWKAAERAGGAFVPLVGISPGGIPVQAGEFTLETGVIVLATGFQTYTPRPGEYGFGEFPEIVTLSDFIEKTAETDGPGRFLEIDGRPIRSLALIHCVGSRQIPGIHEGDASGQLNEYCSRTCCTAGLQAGLRIRETYPGTRVFDFYRDIRTYGRGQEELYQRASKSGVVFLRFEADRPPSVARSAGDGVYPLQVTVTDTLTFGEEVEVPVDLVVLATGMEPSPIPELVKAMKLPVGADRFLLEVHPKLRPVELSISGILLAGTCQAPMDIGEACAAAGAAAVKASGILGRGYVELDPFVAEVDLDQCRGTGACVAACLSEGALRLVDLEVDGQTVTRAQVFPALCLGCGACAAVCPENAIRLKGWTLKQYETMVDMIVADEGIS
jgi:heterodisulfide reductase subunit A2